MDKAREGALNRHFVAISLELGKIETDIATATTEVDRVQDKLRRLETARAQRNMNASTCLLKLN